MKISKEQYGKLLKFVGYGDLENAKVLFFGNEEGTGNFPVEANIVARCEKYGKDTQNDGEIYWQKNSLESDKILYDLVDGESKGIKKPNRTSKVLRIMSKIACAINDVENGDKWIACGATKNDKDYYSEQVYSYMQNKLLSGEEEGFKLALVDWAPLPRPTQDSDPEEYKDVINMEMYEKEFYFSAKDVNEDSFTNYREDVNKRKDAIKECFNRFNGNIIIGFGQIDIKEEIFKNIFTKIEFKSMQLSDGKSKYGVTEICDKKLHVFLLPFPDAGRGAFKDGNARNEFFKEFFYEYLKPIL